MRMASRSVAERSGGFIWMLLSYSPTFSSMHAKWCGVTSQVTLAAADGFERVGRGKMRHVQPRFANLLRQRDVAIDDRRFRRRASRAARDENLSRLRASSSFPVIRVSSACCTTGNSAAKTQCHAHHVIVEDGFAVVGHGYGSSALQSGKVGERSSWLARVLGGNGKSVSAEPHRARDSAAN